MNHPPAPPLLYFFANGHADAGSHLRHLVGGKGASLAEMTSAGLNVPPGFTISAACCAYYHESGGQWPPGLEEQVRGALARLEEVTGRRFGRGDDPLLVAVRSGAAESMPGMMDTLLNVGRTADPWQELRAAIEAVFRSWNNERAVTYRRHHRLDNLLGTAVTVQAMVPAEVSGVLFTASPLNPLANEIWIDFAHGLGEALVLGKITPDHVVLDKNTLQVVQRTLIPQAALDDAQLAKLARLGLRVEALLGVPCDVEWAWSDGRFHLLQARPIKLVAAPSVESVRREEIAVLAAKAEPGGTVWSRYNLAEVLPTPTPMTWAIVQRFLSGRGGCGLMYRDLGFDPDPALDEAGVFDLVCGRPYCNLSREARLHFHRLPFEHPFAALKADPRRAFYPQPRLNPARAGWRFWLFLPVRLPALLLQLLRAGLRREALNRTFATWFRSEVIPAFSAEADAALAEDLAGLKTPVLVERLEYWQKRTLEQFGRESLKPTALAALAMGTIERRLAPRLGTGSTQQILRELSMGVRPDPEADLPAAVRDLAAGRIDRATFLRRFGHRGHQEMELAQPRWSEDPAALDRLVSAAPRETTPSEPANLPPLVAREEAELLRTCLGLRETAKHYLMKGFAVLRRLLLELDRRSGLQGGIFYLKPPDLSRLAAGEDLSTTIAAARQRRAAALSLEVPAVLFSDDLEAIGRPVETSSTATFQGTALSAGIAEGPALVLVEPNAPPPEGPYILVCPSTDPAWLPLFVRARGLVLETGGVLSHGAILAREFGLPAVAGLPGITRQLRTGQRLHVNGGSGQVAVMEEKAPGERLPHF